MLKGRQRVSKSRRKWYWGSTATGRTISSHLPNLLILNLLILPSTASLPRQRALPYELLASLFNLHTLRHQLTRPAVGWLF